MSNQIEVTLAGLTKSMPINIGAVDLTGRKVGLVVVDEVNGFCTVGCGPLAPPAPDAHIDQMVGETSRLALATLGVDGKVFALRDHHTPGKAEPPYPPHCEAGTGQELLVGALDWMNRVDGVTVMPKSCINGFVGALYKFNSDVYGNTFVEWVVENDIEVLVVVGICTDICVLQFVQAVLSARNIDMMPSLKDIVVYEPGCATYNLPREVAEQIGLPATLAHPREIAHYIGLYLMTMSGAIIVNKITLASDVVIEHV